MKAFTKTAVPDWVRLASNQSRVSFGLALVELAERDQNVIAVAADTLDFVDLRLFQERFPDRLVDVGIAEQNAMGVASGLATTGLRPYVCGYAPFITARSAEQLRNDVAYANQRVVIGAGAGGISLSVAGGTHHAVEDLALVRNLPNMTVIVPADAHQAWHATLATASIDGPVYIRLGGRTDEVPVTPIDAEFKLGQAETVREGDDVVIIACGCLVAEAVKASEALAKRGVRARVLNVHTLKPLDRRAIVEAAVESGRVVTAEEHRLAGGLGGAVAELLALEHPTPMRMIGMPDEFAVVGPTLQVRERYGMSAEAIVDACDQLLEQ